MVSLSGGSKVYGILGDPVAHSLSPLMQNRAFLEYGIDATYVPFHVCSNDLPSAVVGIRALNVAGVNVTIPHKEAILPLLDHVDPTAQLIGAVNTVVNRDGVLFGYNTDASGFMRSVSQDLPFDAKNSHVVLLGAGGASRAAAVALASSGVTSITIANRHQGRAEKIISDLIDHFPQVLFSAIDYNHDRYLDSLPLADLIVNATSIGLHGEDLKFLPLERIKGSALIYDMIYSLSETPLIKKSRARKLFCADGLGMLAAQGEDAFTLWTDIALTNGFMLQILSER